MDLFVIICKVNVKCFVLLNGLLDFVLSNVNISTDASLGMLWERASLPAG